MKIKTKKKVLLRESVLALVSYKLQTCTRTDKEIKYEELNLDEIFICNFAILVNRPF